MNNRKSRHGWWLAGLLLFCGVQFLASTGPAKLISTPTVSNAGLQADVTGTLEVVEACYTDHAEQTLSVTDEKTGKKHRLNFVESPPEGHLTGERVRVRGSFRGEEISVPKDADVGSAGMEVLALSPVLATGLKAHPKVLYGAGTNANTVMHWTRVHLLIYSDYATNAYTAASITNFSNEFFATNGNSVNTAYLEDSYGAVGFAGDVVICPIAAPSGTCDTGTWMSQANAAAVAQGYTNTYDNYVYICSGACGWAGVAVVGGNWSFDFYTDGGTICHELGHNLGFAHASTEWNNISAWDEYGDSSDFMGASYDWRHNNGPHKVEQGWVAAQPVAHAGTYQISRLEDVPSTVPYPQVLTVPSSSAYGGQADGWPYYFSYKQNIGFDVNSPWTYGLSIDRWGGGGSHTAAIAILSDGQSFTDTQIGLTVKQISHDTNAVTVVITTCVGVAQPYTIAMTSAQLAARTTMLADVAVSTCDLMTITNFDSASAKGGAVTITNNQLFYTPSGSFSGNDTFNYTLVDLSGHISSATVAIYQITQPSYNWDANGVVVGTGGSGTWDNTSSNWDNGANHWPASGTANWALFGGSSGTVSIATGGVFANGLDFKTDGYVITNNTLTLNGIAPIVLVEPNVNVNISSVVAGTTGFAKSGQGILTLSGANTYSGGTTVSQGTLIANNASALGAASGALTLGDSNSAMSSVSFKVDTGVASAVTLAAINTSSFGTHQTITLNAGSALSANASELTVTALNLAGPSPLTIRANNTDGHSTAQDINYRIVGAGISAGSTALTLDGTTATLRTSFPNGSAANNFTGDVVIKGAVNTQNTTYNGNIAANQNLGFTNNNVTVSTYSTWTLVWGGETCGALNGPGNVSLNNQNALNNIGLTLGNNGASGNFSGVISGGFGVAKVGTGTQILSGANTYSGVTTVAAGKLVVSSAQTGTGAITVNDRATLGVTVSGTSQLPPATLTEGSASGPTTNEFSGVSSTTIAPVNTGTLTLKGTTTINIISGSFTVGKIYPLISYTSISGTGGFKLGALPYGVTAGMITNGSSIAVNVTALTPIIWSGNVNGTWDIATTANWKTNAVAATYNDGNAVQFDDTATGTTTVSNMMTVFPSGIIVSNVTKNYTISGSPINGSGSLTKFGGGMLTLSGANSFTGSTAISQGFLWLAYASALPATANVFLGTAATGTNAPTLGVSASVTLNTLTVGTNMTGASWAWDTSGGNVWPVVNGKVTLNSPLKISKAGGNWWAVTFGGKITGNGGGAGNDTLVFDLSPTGNGGNNYWQANNTNANDFLGNVHIKSGNIALQGQPGNVVIPDASGLIIDTGATLTCNIGGLTESFDTLSGGGSLSVYNGTSATFTIGGNNGSSTFNGVITESGGGTVSLVKAGTGALMLAGASSYSGGTTLSGGQLALNNASAIGTGALTIGGTSALDNTSSADLTLAGNNAQNWNANFTYVGSVHNFNLGTGAVTLGTDCVLAVSSNTLTVGGAISGGYTLTKAGAGTLALSGASGYRGATTVSGGTLNLLGTLTASPTITVSNTGTLNGSGTYTGAVTANNGGTVAAVNNALFTLGTLTLGAGGTDATTLNVSVNGTNIAGCFAVNNPGGFVINGTVTVNIFGVLPLTMPGTNIVLSYTGARGGTGSFVLGALPGRSAGQIVDTGAQILVVVTNYTPAYIHWTGTPANNWDNTGNLVWNVISNGAPAAFFAGDVVTFDDTAVTFGVNLAASVAPGGMTVNATNSYIISGAGGIAGPGSLTKKGSGTLTLASANSYAGGTTISNGTVAFVSGGLGGGTVTMAGSSTVRWIGNNTASLNLSLANGITATLDLTSNNVTQSAALSGTGTALVKAGAGALTLGGSNTFTGGVTINAGTLSLNNASALNSNSLALNANNVTLQAGNYQSTVGPVTVAVGVSNVNLVADNNSATATTGFKLWGITLNSPLTITYNRINGQWDYLSNNQKITGPGGGSGNDSLIFVQNGGSGNPYFEFDGANNNDFVGNVHVKSGSWAVQGFGAFVPGTTQVFPAGSMLILDSGTIWTWNNATAAFVQAVDGLAGSGNMSKNTVNYTLTINANNDNNKANRVFSGSLSSMTGTLTLGGTGKQTFAGANINYGNATAVNNGMLSLSNCTAWASAVTVTSPGVLDFDGDGWSFGKTVSGNGGLSKSGTGTVTLTVSQSNTGLTTVNAGTLLLSSTLPVPPVAGMAIWLDASVTSTIHTNGSGQISAWDNQGVQGGSFTMATTANRPSYVAGGAAFNSKPVVSFASASSQCLTNLNITDANATLQVFIVMNQSSSAGSYAGMLSFENSSDPNDWQNGTSECFTTDSGGNNMIIQRSNGYVMSTANGTTYIADYCYDGANMYGFLNGSKVTTAGSSGSFEINYAAIGGRFGGGTSLGNYWNGRIAEILVYTNVLTTAQRQSIEVYLGQKWVSSSFGIVSLNNASAVFVASGATFGGIGSAGAVTVQSGGKLAPGLSGIGTLTLNTTPSLAGTTLMKINKGASPNADNLVVSGNSLAYGGTLTATNISTNALALGDSFTLFSASSYGGNFAVTNLPPLNAGLKWNWTPTNGTLAVVNSVNTNPTNVMFTVSSRTLNLSWPADHLGWHLQWQTNSLTTGLGTNWITVPGSDTMNSTNIAIDPLKATVFYRLVYP